MGLQLVRCGTATFAPAAPAPRPSLRNQCSARACGQWPAALSQSSSPCLPGWGQGFGFNALLPGSLCRLSPGFGSSLAFGVRGGWGGGGSWNPKSKSVCTKNSQTHISFCKVSLFPTMKSGSGGEGVLAPPPPRRRRC